jgi:molybdopterin-binding protein
LRIENLTVFDDRAIANIGDQKITLPISAMPRKSPTFVQFRPADVILSREDVAGLSVRNHLRGRVCQVLSLGNAVFVATDIGQIVWAEITPQAARELEIETGKPIVCLLKAHSLSLVP